MKCGRRKTIERRLERGATELENAQFFRLWVHQGTRLFMLTKTCINVNCYLKGLNVDYASQQSGQLLHTVVKYGY
jgi:hypothetical protein